MLKPKRFEALCESYGADLERWPAETRRPARALIADSARARALLGRAAMLDAVLAEHSRASRARWVTGEAAAVARLRARVGRRLTDASEPAAKTVDLSVFRRFSRLTQRLGVATAGLTAIVAGVLVGGLYDLGPEPASLLSVLKPAPIALLADAR